MCHSSSPPRFWVSTLQTVVILNAGSRVVEDAAALMWICWFLAPVIAVREDHVLQGPWSPGLPQPLQLQRQELSVGSQPMSRPCEAHLVTGSSLLWGSAFHARCPAPGRCLWALPTLRLCLLILQLLWSSAALRSPFPREAGLVPWQGQQGVRVMPRGNLGAGSCGPVPGPPVLCSAGQLRSSPRK